MKVIDLQPYRIRRDIEKLGKIVSQLALESNTGSVREMKICFKKWLLLTARG